MKKAMSKQYSAISEMQVTHTNAFYILAGDFEKASLKSILKNLSACEVCNKG